MYIVHTLCSSASHCSTVFTSCDILLFVKPSVRIMMDGNRVELPSAAFFSLPIEMAMSVGIKNFQAEHSNMHAGGE